VASWKPGKTQGAVALSVRVVNPEEIGGGADISGQLPAALTAAGNLKTAVQEVVLPAAVYSGQNDVAAAGTAEVLGSAQLLLAGVTIKAKSGNVGSIFVGNSGVDNANGFTLAAGELIFVEVSNVSAVYIDAATNGDGVSWVGS